MSFGGTESVAWSRLRSLGLVQHQPGRRLDPLEQLLIDVRQDRLGEGRAQRKELVDATLRAPERQQILVDQVLERRRVGAQGDTEIVEEALRFRRLLRSEERRVGKECGWW